MKDKKTILLYPNQTPPGNLYDSGYDFETVSATSYDYSNDITLSNLKTYYGVTTPRLFYIESKHKTNTAVIIIPGGGNSSLSFEPEASEAIEYWKTKQVNIFVLIHRLPSITNNLNTSFNIYEIYNSNSICFLTLFDLHRAFNIVKHDYCNEKIILHGFSAGGQLAASYTAIQTYNIEIMNDICAIVEDSTLTCPSPLFYNFIYKFTTLYYKKNIYENSFLFIVLNYPYVDNTCPQELIEINTNVNTYLLPVYNNSIYKDINVNDAIFCLQLLISQKLYSDPVADPINNTSLMSMITDRHPPVYTVSTGSDPFIQVTILNMYCQNLISNNIYFVRQFYPSGGHGWGMGDCFSYNKTYPLDSYPYKFYSRTVTNPNINYGSDCLNNSYEQRNADNWFNPPWNGSIENMSLDNFCIKYIL